MSAAKRFLRFPRRVFMLLRYRDAIVFRGETLSAFLASLMPTVSGYGDGPCSCQFCGALDGDHLEGCNGHRILKVIDDIQRKTEDGWLQYPKGLKR